MCRDWDIQDVIAGCQDEDAQFRTGQPVNTRYCLELFRRALEDGSQKAWSAIYNQYRGLVASWIRGHHLFNQVDEEVDHFINAAFDRMWDVGEKLKGKQDFKGVGQYLSYLRTCVRSLITDQYRKERRDGLWEAKSIDQTVSAKSSPEQDVEREEKREEIIQILRTTLQAILKDDIEALVARESWEYGLPPREIRERHPDLFETTEEVSRIKTKLMKRLRYHLQNSEDL